MAPVCVHQVEVEAPRVEVCGLRPRRQSAVAREGDHVRGDGNAAAAAATRGCERSKARGEGPERGPADHGLSVESAVRSGWDGRMVQRKGGSAWLSKGRLCAPAQNTLS